MQMKNPEEDVNDEEEDEPKRKFKKPMVFY